MPAPDTIKDEYAQIVLEMIERIYQGIKNGRSSMKSIVQEAVQEELEKRGIGIDQGTKPVNKETEQNQVNLKNENPKEETLTSEIPSVLTEENVNQYKDSILTYMNTKETNQKEKINNENYNIQKEFNIDNEKQTANLYLTSKHDMGWMDRKVSIDLKTKEVSLFSFENVGTGDDWKLGERVYDKESLSKIVDEYQKTDAKDIFKESPEERSFEISAEKKADNIVKAENETVQNTETTEGVQEGTVKEDFQLTDKEKGALEFLRENPDLMDRISDAAVQDRINPIISDFDGATKRSLDNLKLLRERVNPKTPQGIATLARISKAERLIKRNQNNIHKFRPKRMILGMVTESIREKAKSLAKATNEKINESELETKKQTRHHSKSKGQQLEL